MAYGLADGAILQITTWGAYQGQAILNVFHYRLARPGGIMDGAGEVLGATQKFRDAVIEPAAGVKWMDWLVDQFNMEYIRGQVIYPTRYAYEQVNYDQTGNVVQPGIASNLGATVSLQSETAGRGKTGSKHFTGFDRAKVVNGVVDAGLRTSIEATTLKFLTALPCTEVGGGNWRFVIWNPAHPATPSTVHNSWCQTNARVMRRRTLRVGI